MRQMLLATTAATTVWLAATTGAEAQSSPSAVQQTSVISPTPSAPTANTPSTSAQLQPRLSEQIEDIIVTAQKRSENLQKAPAAITAVSGLDFAQAGAVSLTAISNLFPSARLEQFFASAHLYVRGIGAEQDRVTVDQLVNVFVDGVVMPREMVGISQSDVGAVELLPGPQGTLYGASSVGGVLSVRNNRPNDTNENRLTLEYGTYHSLHFTDVQNVKINDVLALRGSFDYVNHSAYETTDRWTANTLNARIGVLFTPSNSFSAYIWAQAYDDNSISQETGFTDASGNWIPKGNPWDALNDCATMTCNGVADRPLQPPQRQISHDYIASGQFDWHLKGFTITDIPSFLKVDLHEMVSTWIFTNFLYQVNEQQLTNELKIASDEGPKLQWLAGVYLYQNKADSRITFAGFDIPRYTLQNAAPYAQLTYSVSDALRVTAGARYNWTRKVATFNQPNMLPETSANWSNVDWKLGAAFDLSSSTMAYGTFQTGSSPGTLDPGNVVNGRPNITKLTKLNSFTAGWKSKLLDNRLQLNNEAFYYDYSNFLIQTVVCSDPTLCYPLQNIYLNAPKLISWGDQLDVRWLVTDNDAFHLGYSFTSAKTGHWVTNAGADLSHQTIMEAPRNTFTIGARHTVNLHNGGEIILRADSYISSGYYADFQTQPGTPVHSDSVHQRSYSTTDVALTYHSPQDRWTLGLYGRNLENTAQFGPASVFSPGSFKNVAALVPISGIPRTFGVQFTLRSLTGS